jgi:nitroimidazol reductase NimA-like FMN-containing flavoprotein (pyridoxamine 5'-phosphate oxidase superfamily)
MLKIEPVAKILTTTGTMLPTWDEARERLADSQFYWLATVHPHGRPHVVPVLAVWFDGALHFVASPGSRKARNLNENGAATITVDSDDLHIVVEGTTTTVRETGRLQGIADEYEMKYGWLVTIRDGAYYGQGAPTAGPPPYEVYRLSPSVVFAFGSDESFTPTRWRF